MTYVNAPVYNEPTVLKPRKSSLENYIMLILLG